MSRRKVGYSSAAELIVRDWLSEYKCEFNNRSILKAPSGHWMELDLYLPEEHFAVECDGEHYHQESDMSYNKWQLIVRGKKPEYTKNLPKWKGYAKWKDDHCAEQGIKLIHVVSEDVLEHPEETKAYIFEELEKWKSI